MAPTNPPLSNTRRSERVNPPATTSPSIPPAERAARSTSSPPVAAASSQASSSFNSDTPVGTTPSQREDTQGQAESVDAQLRAELSQKDTELEELRRQIAALQQSQRGSTFEPNPVPRSVSFGPDLRPPRPHDSIEGSEETAYESRFPPKGKNVARSPSIDRYSLMSAATRIEKIPNLPSKLSDGVDYSPRLWEVQVRNALNRYDRYFLDETHRMEWVLHQTEGMAQTFLEPSFLEPTLDEDGSPQDALDLVQELVSFLTNPHEQQTARDNYNALYMGTNEPFWEFYHKFRTLARTARMMDESILKMDLRDKIPPRLRRQLHSQYKNTTNLQEWVAEIQAEDQGQMAEWTVYRTRGESTRQATPASRRHVKETTREKAIYTSSPLLPYSKDHSNASLTLKSSTGFPSAPRSTPARADPPRATSSTPATAPRHFSYQQPHRSFTPRVNAIQADDERSGHSDSASEDDNSEVYEDAAATQPVEEPTPRVKDRS